MWLDTCDPWSYLGLRHLRTAMSRCEHVTEMEVYLHAYLLDPDLEAFSLDRIIPCGIADAGVTSLTAETGRHLETSAPADALVCALENHLAPLVADAT